MPALEWDNLRHAPGGWQRRIDLRRRTGAGRQPHHGAAPAGGIEAQLGTRLFDRQRGGYLPTEADLVLLEQARHMATRAEEVERQVLGRDRELTGSMR